MVNAVKFNKPKGKITVNFKIRNFNDSDYFEMKVRDEGIGIEPERIKDIFTLFNNVSEESQKMNSAKSFSKATQGIGLGLSTSKYLLEVQGGTLSIKSQLNTFTEVTLRIRVQ